MSDNRYPAIIFFFVVLLSLVLPVFYYSRFPETVASHFNMNNEANAWMDKKSFLIIQVAVTVFLSGMFLAFIYFISKMSKSTINLPNKDYWLSDERKEKSYGIIQRFMYWLGSITLSFLAVVFQQVYLFNVNGQNKLNSVMWYLVALFVIGTTFLVYKMVSYFNKPHN